MTAALAVAAVQYSMHASFTVDDAAITFAYVRTFVDGGGLGFLFAGDYRVEGYSNLTWFLLLALAHAAGMSVLVAAKLLGAVFTLGAVAIAHTLAWRLLGDRRLAAGVVAVGASLVFVLWSASGLENSLMAFLALALVWALTSERAAVRYWLSAGLSVALALTRPEGFLYGGAALVAHLLAAGRGPRPRTRALRATGVWTVGVVGVLALYAWWHIRLFGVLLPNTVYAKVPTTGLLASVAEDLDPTGPSARYTGSYLVKSLALVLVPVAAAGAWALRRGRGTPLLLVTVAALALPLREPDWMVHSRFYATFTPLFVVVALVGTDRVVRRLRGRANLLPRITRIVAMASVPIFALANVGLAVQADRSGYPLWTTGDQMSARYLDLADSGRRAGLVDPLYLIPDIGAVAYEDDFRIVDALGLSDVHTARGIMNAPVLDLYLFGERRPDLVRLHWPHDVDTVPVAQLPGLDRDYVRIPTVQDQGDPRAWIRRTAITVPTDPNRPALTRGGGVAALGSTTSVLAPEAVGALDLLWRTAPAAGSQATAFRLDVRSTDGSRVQARSDALGYGWLPPDRWQPDETVRQRVDLAGLPAGRYTVTTTLTAQDGKALAETTQPLVVDTAAAAAATDASTRAAAAAAAAGDWSGVHADCRAAELTGGVSACAQVVTRARAAALGAASAALDEGDLAAAAAAAQEVAAFRGRGWPSPAEQQLSAAAAGVFTATAPGGAGDAARYHAALTAATIDPTDAPATLRLECARRAFLGQVAGSTC